jgi:type I restriction enzyme S subunit
MKLDTKTAALPVGWKEVCLEQVVEILDRLRVPLNAKQRAERPGPYPYYGANGQVGNIDDFIFDGDFAILAEDGGHFNDPFRPVAYRVEGKFWVNNHAHVLRTLDQIPTMYLVHFLNSSNLMPFVGGSTRLKLNQGSMRQIPIRIAPLNEQRRIVAKIEDLTARSRAAKQALDAIPPLLERFRQSVLAAAFRGDLTKQWRHQNPNTEPARELLKRIRQERRHRWEQDYLEKQKAKGKTLKNDKWKEKYKEPEPVDTTDLPELPEGWCWANVGNLFDIDSGQAFKKKDYSDSGFRLLQIANVSFGETLWEQENFLPQEFGEAYSELRLSPGEIVMALNRPILGRKLKVARVSDSDLPAILYQRVGRLKPVFGSLGRFGFLFFRGRQFLLEVQQRLKGTDQPYLNTSLLPQIPVPLPPAAESDIILKAVEDSLALLETVGVCFQEAERRALQLDQSILAKAFRGELVPQDPKDEPASALLDRIRAERKAGKTKGSAVLRIPKVPKEVSAVKKTIIQALSDAEEPMTPEALFKEAGCEQEDVDGFYAQLRTAIAKGLIVQEPESPSPEGGNVLLRLAR